MVNRITLHCDARTGWSADFSEVAEYGAECMRAFGTATLPLPWTAQASFARVSKDVAKRFPGVMIVKQTKFRTPLY